jgi:hypothetical protein
MEEDVNCNTSSIGRATQPQMTHGLTTATSMPQNSSRNSTNRPLRVDERYKETPKVPKNLHLPTPLKHSKTSSQLLFSQSSPYIQNMYATTTVGPHLIPLAPTLSPSPTLIASPDATSIPLPPSNTCTVASTRVASPEYMPRTPSPVKYWMPEDEDIKSNHGAAAEHTAFVAARHFTYDLSWLRAIHINRCTDPRGPPALPVCIIVTRLSQMGVYSLIIQVAIRAQPAQPTPVPALTQQQLQWLEEDLHPEL